MPSVSSVRPVVNSPTGREIRIAAGLAAALLFSIVFATSAYDQSVKADFAVLYTGGWMLRHGNAAELYDLNQQMQAQERFLGRKGVLFDPYPPFHALLFAPLATMDYRKAYVVWGAINALLWLFFQHLLRRHAGASWQPFRYLLLCSLFPPLWVALMQGQPSVLLLVVFSLTFVYLRWHRDGAAGFFLGLGLLKFQLVLPFALICLLRRKWSFMAGFALAACLLGVLSVITVGPAGMRSYAGLLLDIVKHPSNLAYSPMKPWHMPTVRGLVAGLLGGRLPEYWVSGLAAAMSGCLILLAAWSWRQQERRGNQAGLDLTFAAALAVSLATAPYLFVHDLTPMLLSVVLVIGSPQWAQPSRGRLLLNLAVAILYVAPLCLLLLQSEALYVLAPVLVAFVVATVTLAPRGRPQSPVPSYGSTYSMGERM